LMETEFPLPKRDKLELITGAIVVFGILVCLCRLIGRPDF
jgi:hypothetical protein